MARGPSRAGRSSRTSSNRHSLAEARLDLEPEEALSAGALAFMARFHIQATLPHREPADSSFDRRNGKLCLSIYAHPEIGLPFGRYPRLLLVWITSEALRTQKPLLHLGPCLSRFMAQLGVTPAGGPRGPIRYFRDQMRRLFSATISYTWAAEDDGHWQEGGFKLADQTVLWWNPRQPEKAALWGSTVKLSQPFFDAVVSRPVPIDLRAIRALRSPLAFDIYTWLTYRFSYLRTRLLIPWSSLRLQFGANYTRPRAFKQAFLHHTKRVLAVYPAARLEERRSGLLLKPSPPHVAKRPPR